MWVRGNMPIMSALLVTLAAISLADNVASPGAGRVAVGAGVEGVQRIDPTVDVRVGVHDLLGVLVEASWHPRAPLLGLQLRVAAGRTRDAFAAVWFEGHLRPVLTSEVTDVLAGGDLGLGVGLAVRGGDFTASLDGGFAVGMPRGGVALDDIDPTRVDQQGGFFGVQRLALGYDLSDHFGVVGQAAFALPLDSVRYNRRGQEILGVWETRLGARLVARF